MSFVARRLASSALVTSVVLAGTATAMAQPTTASALAPPGASHHAPQETWRTSVPSVGRDHTGLFVRVVLGPALTGTSAPSDDTGSLRISGSGAVLGVAVGVSVKKNIIVFAEVFDDVVFGSSASTYGVSARDDGEVSASILGVGAGMTGYIMPANVYLSGMVAATQLTADDRDSTFRVRTEWGAASSFRAGKEWWVSKDLGVGVGAQVGLAAGMYDRDRPRTAWAALSAGLLISATYN